jgi:hypothetical protein
LFNGPPARWNKREKSWSTPFGFYGFMSVVKWNWKINMKGFPLLPLCRL